MSATSSLPTDIDFDLAGLCAALAPLLLRLPVADQRVQSTPDVRTIRFYQSTGLLDRPTRYDGRNARYNRRHLLQVLAIRVLQAQRRSLAQIQAEVAGATDSELSALVDMTLSPYAPDPALSATGWRGRVDRDLPARTGTPRVATSPTVSAAPILTSAEITPGLVVTVDSRFHPDPARVIEQLRRAIQGAAQ